MKDEIKTMIKASLVKEFGDLFSPKLLTIVAEDRAKELTEKVRTFIANEAMKGISMTKIQKEYLSKKTLNKPLGSTNSNASSNDTKDKDDDNQTPDFANLGTDLSGKDTSLTNEEVSDA